MGCCALNRHIGEGQIVALLDRRKVCSIGFARAALSCVPGTVAASNRLPCECTIPKCPVLPKTDLLATLLCVQDLICVSWADLHTQGGVSWGTCCPCRREMRRLSRQALSSAAAHQQAHYESLTRGLGGEAAPSDTFGDRVDAVPPFQQQGSRRRPSRCAGTHSPRVQGGLQPLVITPRVLGKDGGPTVSRVLCVGSDSRLAGRA